MINYQKEIKLCALNTHGAKGNLVYINKLVKEYDIVFLNETWLFHDEKSVIVNRRK